MKKVLLITALMGVASAGLLTTTTSEAALITNGGASPYGGTKCMDVWGGQTTASTAVQVYDCHGWSNQQFTMQGLSIFTIGSTGSAQNCLDVVNGGTTDGTPVGIYPCHGGNPQKWYYHNGRLINIGSNKCLDAGDRSNGRRLVINTCNGAVSQQWQIK